MANGFTSDKICGRLVDGRPPEDFKWQMAFQMVKFADVWSTAGRHRTSNGKWLYKDVRGRMGAGGPQECFKWPMSLQMS